MYRVFCRENNWTALHPVLRTHTTLLYEKELDHVLIPKFDHDKRSTDWLGQLKFVREIPLVQNYRYCQVKTLGRKLYLYKSESSTNTTVLHQHLLDWPFPDKYSPTKGLSVQVFKFHLKDLTNPLKNLLEPSQDLIQNLVKKKRPLYLLLTILIRTTKELMII